MSEKIVQFNEEIIKGQIKELVRGSVEETLNELLEKEAELLTQAARYERSEARQGYRSGHYDRRACWKSPILQKVLEIVENKDIRVDFHQLIMDIIDAIHVQPI